jgi:hypothetical protein
MTQSQKPSADMVRPLFANSRGESIAVLVYVFKPLK